MNYIETRTANSKPEFVLNSTREIINDGIDNTKHVVNTDDSFSSTSPFDNKILKNEKEKLEETVKDMVDKLHGIKTTPVTIKEPKKLIKNSHSTIFNTNQLNNIVEHPGHYGAGNGGLQCIEAMLQTFGKQATLDFCKLNAFKYIWRSDHKTKEVQDMEKAKRYLEYWHILNKIEGDSDDGTFHDYLNS